MSDVSTCASVRIMVADYVGADSSQKVNMIGGGVSVIGQMPTDQPLPVGPTAPFGITVSITVPPQLYGAQCALELLLEDEQGDPVVIARDGAEPQLLRIGQTLTLEEPLFQGWTVPRGAMPARAQWVMMFGAGLPLPRGQRYRWRVRVDGESRDDWMEDIYVPIPQGGVVLG